MSYQISQAYCWYNEGTMIVKMYFISEIPFTFDELPEGHLYDQDLKELADKQRRFEPEDLFKNSFYLIDEEAHPLLFEMDLENPQDLPEDIMEFNGEDLSS
jgi:hypothetical protein